MKEQLLRHNGVNKEWRRQMRTSNIIWKIKWPETEEVVDNFSKLTDYPFSINVLFSLKRKPVAMANQSWKLLHKHERKQLAVYVEYY